MRHDASTHFPPCRGTPSGRRVIPALLGAAVLGLITIPGLLRAQDTTGQAPADPATASAAAPTAPAAKPEMPEALPNGDIRLGGITLHRAARELSFPAKIQIATGIVEVLIAKSPEGRLYESLLGTEVRPFHLQTLLILLGAKNGIRFSGREQPQGDLFDLDVQWRKKDGSTVREPVENWILNNNKKAPMTRVGWVFVGTTFQNGVPDADVEGNLVLTWSSGSTVLDMPVPEGDVENEFVINEQHPEPPVDTPVTVFVKPRPPAVAMPKK